MQKTFTDEYRFKDKVHLTRRVNFFSCAFSIALGLLCLFVLDIKQIIPHLLIGFGIVNLVNILAYNVHRNLTVTYNIASVLSLITTIGVTLFSGGINSPFIFLLAVIVFAAYVTTRVYGKIYLYLNIFLVTLLFLESTSDLIFTTNVVPEKSENIFSFLSVLFAVYLLGGVLGKNLLRVHHDLYKSRNEVESRVKEKETLLKEVHHRVKNNLQTVSSLLSLQARNVDDAPTKNLLKNSQNRVISMAMVHEMLYMREDISKIGYKSYVQELAEYLVRSIKGTSSNITLDIDIPDVKLNIDTAIPLGLLINEAVTNALKYGIVDDSQGYIFIKLRKGEDDEYVLNIGDTGVGYSETINHKTTKSLGLKLIHNLARQLRGSIMRDITKKGTHYIIKFREIRGQIPSVA